MAILERTPTLHVCLACSSRFVQPVEWEPAGPEGWRVLLRCPECEVYRTGYFAEEAIEALDIELAIGDAKLYEAYMEIYEENLGEDIERLRQALEADALLPEDF